MAPSTQVLDTSWFLWMSWVSPTCRKRQLGNALPWGGPGHQHGPHSTWPEVSQQVRGTSMDQGHFLGHCEEGVPFLRHWPVAGMKTGQRGSPEPWGSVSITDTVGREGLGDLRLLRASLRRDTWLLSLPIHVLVTSESLQRLSHAGSKGVNYTLKVGSPFNLSSILGCSRSPGRGTRKDRPTIIRQAGTGGRCIYRSPLQPILGTRLS